MCKLAAADRAEDFRDGCITMQHPAQQGPGPKENTLNFVDVWSEEFNELYPTLNQTLMTLPMFTLPCLAERDSQIGSAGVLEESLHSHGRCDSSALTAPRGADEGKTSSSKQEAYRKATIQQQHEKNTNNHHDSSKQNNN